MVMKLKYEDSILEKIVDFFWYDCKLWKVKDALTIGIPNFFKNIWRFRRELYQHQWWDYHFTLQMLHRSLVIMADKLEVDGIEVDSHRLKKVTKIRRVIQIIKSKIDGDYIGRAESELGEIKYKSLQYEKIEGLDLYQLVDNDTPEEKKHANKVYKRARAIEESEWKELWQIFEGQDYKEYSKFLKSKTKEEQRNNDIWNEWFDGSGMRGWWD
jgi:hypothetical protein